MTEKRKSCKAKKADGSHCQAATLPGSRFCFFHDPARAKERKAAQSFGGSQNRMKILSADAPDIEVRDCRDVVRLISATINQVRKGTLDPKVANAVGYLANVLIKAVEQGEMDSRLLELEAVIKGRHASSLELVMTGTDL